MERHSFCSSWPDMVNLFSRSYFNRRQKCFGNTLLITDDTYRKAVARVADADYAITQAYQDDDVDAVATLFSRIERDCASVFPELKIFHPGGPLFDDLVNITKAYSFYRSGFAYIPGSHAIAATLLVNLDPFNAFVALANALNRPLALAFLSGDEMAVPPSLRQPN